MTVPVWNADYELTIDAAALLIALQFPALIPVRIEMLGAGWDNVAYRVNEEYVFRFPRRKMGADLIANEVRALPNLAHSVHLPIPVPEHIGDPHGDYPYPFAGYRLIPGTTACRVDWTDEARAENAAALARFLSALHSIPVTTETRTWAPGDLIRRMDIPFRLPQLKERLEGIDGLVSGIDIGRLRRRVADLDDSSLRTEPGCWVHGDLYARHLLVDEHLCLCGVIDWGDVHLGDPAVDLSIVYSFLPPSARPAFWTVYGEVDTQTQQRARFRAIHYGALLTTYGIDVGDEAIRRVAEYALKVAAE